MALDRSFVELNRASTGRIRKLAGSLGAQEMQRRVGEHWTVAITLAHLAFWDLRVLALLDKTEQEGKVTAAEIDVAVNDLSLPFWAALPPEMAAKICLETAEKVDARLEQYPAALLEAVYAQNRRWVLRGLHRGEHLDEVDRALQP